MQYLFLRVCCHLRTMKSSWISCSLLPPGTHMRNYGFTPVPPSKHLKQSLRRLAPSSDVSPERLVRHMIPGSFHKRRQPVDVVKLLWWQRRDPLPEEINPQQAQSNADSIYRHTSYTLLGTMRIQYGSLAPQTIIRHKWYVPSSNSPIESVPDKNGEG